LYFYIVDKSNRGDKEEVGIVEGEMEKRTPE